MNTLKPNIPIFLLTLCLIALLFFSAFETQPLFFQHLITAKSWRLEQLLLVVTVFLGIKFLFIRQFRITQIDFFIILLFLWWTGMELIIPQTNKPIQEVIFSTLTWSIVFLFIRTSMSNGQILLGIVLMFLIAACAQSVLGLMQLYNLYPSHHGLFRITGTFHNPGPFSGFVVSALPLAISSLILYSHTNPKNEKNKLLKTIKTAIIQKDIYILIYVISLSSIIVILLILPAAQSRASWVAAALSSFYVVYSLRKELPILTNLTKRLGQYSRIKKTFLISSIAILIIISGMGLYKMKQGSANGRLLIWEVTSQIIKKQPITGHGSGAFSVLYMREQAKWFKKKKDAKEQMMVAGSPESPFNEALRLWLEKGLVGILLVGTILALIFFPGKHASTENHSNHPLLTKHEFILTGKKGALIALLAFSLFSYPFDISSFTLQLVTLVAIFASFSKPLHTIKGRKCLFFNIPIALLLIGLVIFFLPKREAYYTALKKWKDAEQFYKMSSYETSVEIFEEAYPTLKQNGLFLQMYGKALSLNNEPYNSNTILKEAQKYKSSYIIQTTLGDNLKSLGHFDLAEKAYKKSSFMVPSMLLPKYLLANLYQESGQEDEAQKTAKEILSMPIKVESTAINQIRHKMKQLVKYFEEGKGKKKREDISFQGKQGSRTMY